MEDFSLSQRYQLPLTTSQALYVDSKLAGAAEFTRNAISVVPAHWVDETIRGRGFPSAMPMCKTLFLVEAKSVADMIREHITYFDFGEDIERSCLVDCGWGVIPRTGLFVLEIDGFLLLGIDGIGYDFLEAHWLPLYDLLGLGWHLDD